MLSDASFRQVVTYDDMKLHFVNLIHSSIEILRRSAENTMHALVRAVFHRLNDMDPAAEEHKLSANDDEGVEGELKMTVSANELASNNGLSIPSTRVESEEPASVPEGDTSVSTEANVDDAEKEKEVNIQPEENAVVEPPPNPEPSAPVSPSSATVRRSVCK